MGDLTPTHHEWFSCVADGGVDFNVIGYGFECPGSSFPKSLGAQPFRKMSSSVMEYKVRDLALLVSRQSLVPRTTLRSYTQLTGPIDERIEK